jgi:hypothetical protein
MAILETDRARGQAVVLVEVLPARRATALSFNAMLPRYPATIRKLKMARAKAC